MLRHVTLMALLLFASLPIAAATLNDPPPPPSAPAAPLALPGFIAGTWRGTMEKDFVEEMWSEAKGNSMMGAFRWVGADGDAAMFELLTITKEADGIRMRMRHHTRLLGAKEAIDKPSTLKLTESSSSRAVFDAEKDTGDASRCIYERSGDDLAITVEFGRAVAPREPLKFVLKRA